MSAVVSPIGPLPRGWELRRLSEVAVKIGSGATPTGGEKVYLPVRVGFALVRSQHVFDHRFGRSELAYISDQHANELRNARLQEGDVLLNITGDGITFGRACLVPRDILPACVNQHVSIIRVDSRRCDPRFLVSYLTHPLTKEYMESFNAGGSRRAITKGHIESFEIPLPPLPEQRRIGTVLQSFDDKIDLNRRMGATLEGMARAIFQAWFVDFEPVRAKAAGERLFPGMPQAVFDTLPNQFQDSPLGPIPEGWSVAKLSECAKLTMGQSPPSEFYNESGLGLPFHQGVTDYGFRFPTHRVYCSTSGREAQPGDVLLSVRAPVGRINVADARLILGRGVSGLRHSAGSQSYLYYLLRHLFLEEDAIGDGTIYKAVTKQYLASLPVLAPQPGVALAFDDIATPMDGLIASTERESRKLAETRDYLLPKLLSGQVRVGDGERLAVEASA